jgi:hypothetical protein
MLSGRRADPTIGHPGGWFAGSVPRVSIFGVGIVALLIVLVVIGAISACVVLIVKRSKSSTQPGAGLFDSVAPAVAPGWYPDPQNPSQNRYFDGRTWTSSTSPKP